MYETEIMHNRAVRDYYVLLRTVRKFLEYKQRDKNRKELSSPRRGLAAPKRQPKSPGRTETDAKKEDCRAWIAKGTCPRGKKCPYKHDPKKKAERRGNTPSRGRAVSYTHLTLPTILRV